VLTTEEKQQIEQFIRVGCIALQQGKPLEESQQIGATALTLIERLNTVETPAKPPRKK
jgi:hypothetical protein